MHGETEGDHRSGKEKRRGSKVLNFFKVVGLRDNLVSFSHDDSRRGMQMGKGRHRRVVERQEEKAGAGINEREYLALA